MTKTKNPAQEQLLTKEQVASRLAISKRTLDRMIAEDENFPQPIKRNRSWVRFREVEINEYILSLI